MGLRLISSLIRIFLLSRLADIETTMMPSTRTRPSKLLRARLLKGRDRFVSRSPSFGAMSAGLEVTTLLWRDRTVSAARSHVQE